MKQVILAGALVAAHGTFSMHSHAADEIISEQDAIKAALAELGVEVIGIRFDEPDTQWDVFIKSGDQAYEVEVDAVSGEVIAAEAESLEEVLAELSGDLSHEGVEGDVDQ